MDVRLPRIASDQFRTFAAKQELAKPGRYYGDGGTIHGTNHVDVCVDELGHVVQVWFRCQMLPFRASYNSGREYHQPKALLTGVEIRDLKGEE